MNRLDVATHTKTKISITIARSAAVFISVTSLLVSAGMMAVVNTTLAGQKQLQAQLESRIAMSERDFTLAYDLPEYLDESLQHPQHFFSGRKIKIVKRTGKIISPPKTLSFSLRNPVNKHLFAGSTVPVRSAEQWVTAEIPREFPPGYYTFDFTTDVETYSVPLDLAGDGGGGGEAITPILPMGQTSFTITRLNCGICYWELSSVVNPRNEREAWMIGRHSGAGTALVGTRDGWKTSRQHYINTLAQTPRRFFYRGDPKLAYGIDGSLLLTALVNDAADPFFMTGGLYQAKVPTLETLQFSTRELPMYPPEVLQQLRELNVELIADRTVVAVDDHPRSPYAGSTYVFDNIHRVVYGAGKVGVTQYVHVVRPTGEQAGYERSGSPYDAQVDAAGTLYGVYGSTSYLPQDRAPGLWGKEILLDVSRDQARSFTTQVIARYLPHRECAPRISTASPRAWLAADGLDLAVPRDAAGKVYVVWDMPEECVDDPTFEYAQYARGTHVYFSQSADGGATWSVPVRVDDDAAGGVQVHPNIAVDDDGVLFAAFVDHREHPDLPVFDVYLTYSQDGGATWAPNIRVNDISVPNESGGRDPGDYFDMLNVGPHYLSVVYPCAKDQANLDGKPDDACAATLPKSTLIAPKFIRGDANNDGVVDLSDSVFVLGYLFGSDAAEPACADAADANDSGSLDISDSIYLLNFLFNGGPGLPAPGSSAPGRDPTDDQLRCFT